jgi:FOG: Ankyrin repeat
MGGISVLILNFVLFLLLLIAIGAVVGLAILIIGIIFNRRSLKSKQTKSIPAVVSIVIGSIMMVPAILLIAWMVISSISKDIKYKKEMGELAYSIELSDIKKIDSLLEKGEDPNLVVKYYNSTMPVLEIAYKTGDLTVIRKLLEAGANPNVIDENGNTLLLRGFEATDFKNKDGETVNYIAKLKLLIEYGADVTATMQSGISDKNSTALIILAKNSTIDEMTESATIDIFNIILESEVNINAQNSSGETALIKACSAGSGYKKPNIKLIELLLENGADKDILDNWDSGRKALYYFKNNYEKDNTKLTKDKDYYKILEMLE